MRFPKEARAVRPDVLHRKNIDKARLNSVERKTKRRSLPCSAALPCINITRHGFLRKAKLGPGHDAPEHRDASTAAVRGSCLRIAISSAK